MDDYSLCDFNFRQLKTIAKNMNIPIANKTKDELIILLERNGYGKSYVYSPMGQMNQIEKMNINKKIFEITEKEADDDYKKLKKIDLENINFNSTIGNTFVNYYTSLERLDTKGSQGISYFDLFQNRNEFLSVPSIENIIKKYPTKKPNDIYKIWYNIFKLYYGSISIFKPIIAMNIYDRYKPKAILDFTMGWGGRLVGACALDIPNYIGIDLNMDLKKPYQKMVKKLKELGTKTKIKLLFLNALSVDYSKLNYDMVFTSPPYYNIEIYKGTQRQTKKNWDDYFYKPLFEKTYRHLKRGGNYILNVPKEVYDRVCIKLFGEADEMIPLSIRKRKEKYEYSEMIYVWNKQ